MTNTELVTFNDSGIGKLPSIVSHDTENLNTLHRPSKTTYIISEAPHAGCSFIKKAIATKHPLDEVKEITHDPGWDTTTSRYESKLQRWRNHCIHQSECSFSTDVNSVPIFIHGMYKNRYLYSGICVARNAISSAVMISRYDRLSSHQLVSRFVKRLFNRLPPLARNGNIRYIISLLSYYEHMPQNSELDLKSLCKTLDVLFLILRARRNQAMMTTTVKNFILQNVKLILMQSKTLKHSALNRPLKPFAYHRQ